VLIGSGCVVVRIVLLTVLTECVLITVLIGCVVVIGIHLCEFKFPRGCAVEEMGAKPAPVLICGVMNAQQSG